MTATSRKQTHEVVRTADATLRGYEWLAGVVSCHTSEALAEKASLRWLAAGHPVIVRAIAAKAR